jgi:hypothetical protein
MLLYNKKPGKAVKKAAKLADCDKPVYTDTYEDRLAKLAAYKSGRKGLEDYVKK